MIKHIVMWNLKEEANGKIKEENAKEAKLMLEALVGKIPGLHKLEVGIDFNRSNAACDLVLYSELDDKKALEIYRDHPDHVKAAKFIGEITSERHVVDYETQEHEVM